MELKPGYKQTELGVIPDDWDCATISSFATVKTGGKNTQDRVKDGAYPFFVRSQEVERISSFSFDGEAVLTAGDGVGTGKVFHYVNGKFDTHQRVYRISNFASKVDGYFFYLMFSSRFYERIMSMTAKSSVDSVRRNMIVEMQIPTPNSVKEQKAIAEALSDVDALINSLEALLTKKRDIKTGVMQELLTGRTRLPGFTGDWQEVRLGDFVTVLKGRGLSWSKISGSGKFPCLLYGELFTTYRQVIHGVKSRTHSDEGIASLYGDVLMPGSTTTTGEDLATASALLQEGVQIGGDVNIIRPKLKKVDSSWLAYRLSNCHRRQIGTLTQGITIHHLYGREIASLVLPLPSLKEQEAIAQVFSDIDDEIQVLEKRLTKTRDLKQGMAQELLTGRTRLV